MTKFVFLFIGLNVVMFILNLWLVYAFKIYLGWWYFTLSLLITLGVAGWIIYRRRRATPW